MLADLEGRMRRGDLSAFLSWAPEPLVETELDALWVDALAHGPRLPVMLYAHIPHCVSSCNFCMYFHRVTQDEAVHRATLEHLVGRLRRFRETVGRLEIAGGYIGGGTPTAMPIAMLETLLGELHEHLEIRGELTVEAHPGVTSVADVARLGRARATRMSMGVQTFDAALQRQITRLNPAAAHVGELIEAARAAGISTNVDLVVGLPEQTRRTFDTDLEALLALAPDSITIYRYHPTTKLAGGDFDLDAAIGPAQWLRWTKAGYLGKPWSRGDNSVVLMRANGRFARFVAAHVRARLSPAAEIARYENFGSQPRHLLGFGTGAIGHVWGRAWHREITGLERYPGPARFSVTRLTALDEVRCLLRARVGDGGLGLVDAGRLAALAGVDAPELLALERPANRRALTRLGRRWWAPRPGLSEAERRALLDSWMPEGPELTDAWRRDALDGLERELITLRYDRYDHGARRDRSLVNDMCDALGIPAKGLRYDGALVVERDDTGLSFAVRGKGEPLLRVLVSPANRGSPAYVETKRFALSYSGGRELEGREREFIERLRNRLRAVDTRG